MLTATRLREVVSYDKTTGKFTRLASSKQAKAGAEPGSVHSHGYRIIGIDGKKYRANHLAWLYMTGEWPKTDVVDHKDRDRSNDAWDNLREVSQKGNCQNRSRIPGSSSQFVGVAYRQKEEKWTAQIRADGKNYHLGYFDREENAAQAYLFAKPKYHKEIQGV